MLPGYRCCLHSSATNQAAVEAQSCAGHCMSRTQKIVGLSSSQRISEALCAANTLQLQASQPSGSSGSEGPLTTRPRACLSSCQWSSRNAHPGATFGRDLGSGVLWLAKVMWLHLTSSRASFTVSTFCWTRGPDIDEVDKPGSAKIALIARDL